MKKVCETILQAENIKLHKELQVLRAQVDSQEQRSRNECLQIHGIEENDGENTDDLVPEVINNNQGLTNITLDDVQRSHRLGASSKNQRITRSTPRPIICYSNCRHRQEVFKLKRKLKYLSVSISENPTKSRYLLYKDCIVELEKGKVWTNEERTTTRINNRYATINDVDDLKLL